MKIFLLDSYLGGSHKHWAESLKAESSHEIEIAGLEPRHWKWRMHGGAITLAKSINQEYDLFVVTDMVDLSLLKSLNKSQSHKPHIIFFHENQFAYPFSNMSKEEENLSYQFINYTSALVADAIIFNSEFNRRSFLDGAYKLLKRLPDYQHIENLDSIEAKSYVLPIGINTDQLYKFKEVRDNQVPVILWNHRWDYDKNPKAFFETLLSLKKKGIRFQIALLGKRTPDLEREFARELEQLKDEIIINKEASFGEYCHWLWKADILPVTSFHDFFGLSITESLICNTHVLLPKRQVYPERILKEFHTEILYDDLEESLEQLIVSNKWRLDCPEEITKDMNQYNWKYLIKNYDELFNSFTYFNEKAQES